MKLDIIFESEDDRWKFNTIYKSFTGLNSMDVKRKFAAYTNPEFAMADYNLIENNVESTPSIFYLEPFHPDSDMFCFLMAFHSGTIEKLIEKSARNTYRNEIKKDLKAGLLETDVIQARIEQFKTEVKFEYLSIDRMIFELQKRDMLNED